MSQDRDDPLDHSVDAFDERNIIKMIEHHQQNEKRRVPALRIQAKQVNVAF
jgi:hypothetical protein